MPPSRDGSFPTAAFLLLPLELRSVFQNTFGREAAPFPKHDSPSFSIDKACLKIHRDNDLQDTGVGLSGTAIEEQGNNQMLCSIT